MQLHNNHYSGLQKLVDNMCICVQHIHVQCTSAYIPIEDTTTIPRPRARGPPHLRYLSLGAQAAVRLSPPTTPAVYRAARPTSGPGGEQSHGKIIWWGQTSYTCIIHV